MDAWMMSLLRLARATIYWIDYSASLYKGTEPSTWLPTSLDLANCLIPLDRYLLRPEIERDWDLPVYHCDLTMRFTGIAYLTVCCHSLSTTFLYLKLSPSKKEMSLELISHNLIYKASIITYIMKWDISIWAILMNDLLSIRYPGMIDEKSGWIKWIKKESHWLIYNIYHIFQRSTA